MALQQLHFIPFFKKNNIPNIDKPQFIASRRGLLVENKYNAFHGSFS